MQQELTNVVLDIRGNKSFLTTDEASIKMGVVLRLLRVLGWDPFDTREITPEYIVGGRRVDFALRVLDTNRVFVEVKRPREDLESHQEQLLSYSFAEGVRLAVLTNGITWWFYLPLSEGSWEQRRFYSVDILEQESADVAKRLEEFLSKSRIVSGEAIRAAEHIYRGRQKTSIIRDAIPKAWNKLLTDPDDLFIDLLIETTERLCGFRPETSEIQDFLKVLSTVYSAVSSQPSAITPLQRRPQTIKPKSAALPARSSSKEGFLNKKVESITLFGKIYYPQTWREVLLTVATEMYRRHPSDFEQSLNLTGTKMIYFSKHRGELIAPKPIVDSGYYCETNLSSDAIVRRSRELLTLFGHRKEDLELKTK